MTTTKDLRETGNALLAKLRWELTSSGRAFVAKLPSKFPGEAILVRHLVGLDGLDVLLVRNGEIVQDESVEGIPASRSQEIGMLLYLMTEYGGAGLDMAMKMGIVD